MGSSFFSFNRKFIALEVGCDQAVELIHHILPLM